MQQVNVIDTTKGFCYLVKGASFYLVFVGPPFLLVWALRLLLFPCASSLNFKSFSPSESSTSLIPLVTSLRTVCMPLLLNPFSLLPEVYRRGPAGVPL